MPANSNIRTNDPTKVPALPRIPASVGPELRRYLEGIEQITSIRLGRRGDPRDRAITLRELIESGLAQELAASPWDPNRGTAGFVQGGTRLQDLAVPPAPTGFTAVGAFSQVILNWNYPAYANHSHTEVHSHTSDVIGDAQLIGIQNGRIFVDPVGSGQTRYYWVRHVNTDSIAGPFNSASGTVATTAVDVTHMLTLLSGAITSSQLATSLATPIGNLPANTASSITTIETEQTAQGVTIAAQANTISSLNTTVGGNSASISTQASSINGLSAQYSVKIDNNGHVSGFGLSSTTTTAGPTSAFIVRADTFAIVDPASTGNGLGTTSPTADTVPFIYHDGSGTLNGETVPAGVYMKRTFIGEAQIQNAQIKELAADKITSEFLDAARIDVNTIDASKLILDNASIVAQTINGVPTVVVQDLSVGILTGNLIRADKILVDNATIDTDASNRLIIKDLGVDTLQIKGNAVTIPSSSVLASNKSSFPTSFDSPASPATHSSDVMDLTWTSTGADTVAFFSINWTGSGNAGGYTAIAQMSHIKTVSGGTGKFVEKTVSISGSNNIENIRTVFINITPTVGTNTVRLQFKNNQSFANSVTAIAGGTSIFVLETKK